MSYSPITGTNPLAVVAENTAAVVPTSQANIHPSHSPGVVTSKYASLSP